MTQKEYFKNVGMELKVARIRKGLTSSQLCKLTGLSQSCILKIEGGKSDPMLSTLKRIADALGVSLKEIV